MSLWDSSVPSMVERDLVKALQAAVYRPELLPNFIDEEIKRAKKLQQKKSEEFSTTFFSYLYCLECFDVNPSPSDLLCALTALSVLVRLEPSGTYRTQCNSYIGLCLKHASTEPMIRFATKVFSAILHFDDVATKDFIRKQVGVALSWIDLPLHDPYRLSGTLILTEVATQVPDEISPFFEAIFDNTFVALASEQTKIRYPAISLFSICAKRLARVSLQRSYIRNSIYERLTTQLGDCLKSKSEKKNISGLLAFESLVDSLNGTSSLTYECLSTLLIPFTVKCRCLESIDSRVHELLLYCLLALCRYRKFMFITNQLKDTVDFALLSIKSSKQISSAFSVLCQIILITKECYKPYVEATCQQIIIVLQQPEEPCWEALECFSVICTMCPPATLAVCMEACINNVFRWGLSPQLVKSLQTILSAAGTYQNKLEEALLDKVSVTLCGLPFRQTAATSYDAFEQQQATDENIALALNTLIEFSFSNSDLMGSFLADSVLPFVSSRNPSVRNTALQAVMKLLLPGNREKLSVSRRFCVDKVLDYMLSTAVSHEEPDVRLAVMGSFAPVFYPYLSNPKYFDRFYSGVGDESLNCRIESLRQLCNMVNYDPSHIFPVLRKVLCSLLHNISRDFATDTQMVDSLKMLATLCVHAPQYVVHFANEIDDLLLCRFRKINISSLLMAPLLSTYRVFATAVRFFGRPEQSISFREEIEITCSLLDMLPKDRTFSSKSSRLLCFKFLSAALTPIIDHQSPYQLFHNLFRHISLVIHSTDESSVLRLEALKCLGKVGALDVTMFQTFQNFEDLTVSTGGSKSFLSVPSQTGCCYSVLRSISGILDPACKRFIPGINLVMSAVETIMDISQRCPSSRSELHVVVAPLARSMMQLTGRSLATVLVMFSRILQMAGKSAAGDSETLFQLFHYVWDHDARMRFLAVRMFSIVSSANTDTEYLDVSNFQLIPLLLDSLNLPGSTLVLCSSIVAALIRNVSRLQSLCGLLIESLLRSIDSHSYSLDYIRAAVLTVKTVAVKLRVHDSAGAIVRHFLKILHKEAFLQNDDLCAEVVEIFVALLDKLGYEFLVHAGVIVEQLKALNIDHRSFLAAYEALVRGIHSDCSTTTLHIDESVVRLLQTCDAIVDSASSDVTEPQTYSNIADFVDTERVLVVDEKKVMSELSDLVQQHGEISGWRTHFSKTVLVESPFQVFRCIAMPRNIEVTPLTVECPAVANEIVLLAFRVLWSYSSAVLRNAFLNFFVDAMTLSKGPLSLPDEVVGLLLSIAEYMDRCGEPLNLSFELLSECAWSRGILAKALHWQEAAYRENPSRALESLISLLSDLHMKHSATGIFNAVDVKQRRTLFQSSLIKLSRYEEALEAVRQDETHYSSQIGDWNSQDSLRKGAASSRHTRSLVTGATSDSESGNGSDAYAIHMNQLMLCLSRTGRYNEVISEWNETVRKSTKSSQNQHAHALPFIAEYAADACIHLQAWPLLNEIIPHMPTHTITYVITKAVHSIKQRDYDTALMSVIGGRQLLLEELTNIHESYARAYESVIAAQQLTELEEIIQVYVYQEKFDYGLPVQHITKLFEDRIQIMVPSVRVWKQVLGLRGVLSDPYNDVKTRIFFVQLCRIENEKHEENFTLSQLLGHQNPTYEQLFNRSANPHVVMEYIAYAANAGMLGEGTPLGPEKDLIKKLIDVYSKQENASIIARAYAHLGSIMGLRESLDCYRSATLHDPKWHLAWRLMAETSAEILNEEYSDKGITNAIDGYIQSILLGTTESALIQDVLKLLTLWAVHGDQPRGLKELKRRVFDIPTYVWHLVVPQLIAHLDFGSNKSCELVADILTAVALDYPNTLIFPLNLCRTAEDTTPSDRRKHWAIEIINRMEAKYPVLILQGKIVIKELYRLSSLISEKVYDRLEEAASQWFVRRNVNASVATLQAMHLAIPSSPESVGEFEFLSKYGRMLSEAADWIRVYVDTGDLVAVQSAWNIYHVVYRQISDQLKRARSFNMQFHSPKLYEASDLELCLPDGSFLKGKMLSKIASFHSNMIVIASKQRPKRVLVNTSDGRRQEFLLKGREDLRLDERVMQLFVLINILMLSDSRSSKEFGFQVQQYTVTPLTETAGLIGWVEKCDTMHALVKKYRLEKDTPPDLELRTMRQIISFEGTKSYDNLTQISKIEVLEFLAEHTSGHDVRKIMWSSALNCEVWIDQRHQYMTSLANMSIVGYILGLGDRHPNNIMLQRNTGRIVHIDFGDCFEVTMTRDKFPEKVPFRLTRMLRFALDVSGVNGAYRALCETSMSVLRKGSHSVLALMQAFIQDPLISWRLIALPTHNSSSEEHLSLDDGQVLNENKSASGMSMEASVNVSLQAQRKKETLDYNHHGIVVYSRLKSKLEGKDFILSENVTSNLNVGNQVAQLIEEATDITNVSQMWSGWCPFW